MWAFLRPRRLLVLLLLLLACANVAISFSPSNETDEENMAVIDATSSGGEDADLLKWALKHSNPEALKAHAEALKKKDDPDVAERVARVAELIKASRDMPSEAELMVEAVAIIRNEGKNYTVDEQKSALQALVVLVEPIDNADHLLKVPGATAVLCSLIGSAPKLEATAARVIGIAASNNGTLIEELMRRHPELIVRLIQLLEASAEDTAAVAIFTAGQLLRNSGEARRLWTSVAGNEVLVGLVSGGKQISMRTRKKAVTLASDIVIIDPEALNLDKLTDSLQNILQEQVYGSVLDLDLAEKALMAAASVQEAAKGGGGMKNGLGEEVLIKLVEKLKIGENVDEFVMDVISLAEELLRKIGGIQGERDEL